MAKKTSTSKKQVIDKIMEQHRRQLEACWDKAESGTKEGSGEDIHEFVDDLQRLCGSFGSSSLKAYLEERDQKSCEPKKKETARNSSGRKGGRERS